MDPVTITTLAGLLVKLLDWAQTRGFTPTAQDLEAITKARKLAVKGWDDLAPPPATPPVS